MLWVTVDCRGGNAHTSRNLITQQEALKIKQAAKCSKKNPTGSYWSKSKDKIIISYQKAGLKQDTATELDMLTLYPKSVLYQQNQAYEQLTLLCQRRVFEKTV